MEVVGFEKYDDKQRESDLIADDILARIAKMEALSFENYKLRKLNNELKEQISKLTNQNSNTDTVPLSTSSLELETQKFLRKFGLDELIARYKINVNRHEKFPHIVQLKYDQMRSDMRETITQECRGLILDESRDFKTLAYPYKKFFNYNEIHAEKIDFQNKPQVFEKIDGSLMILYAIRTKNPENENEEKVEWVIASSGRPDASGMIRNKGPKLGITTGDLFWRIWKSQDMKLPDPSKNYCYMFEMISEKCPIIIVPEKDTIYFHGARDLDTMLEISPMEIAKANNWNMVPIYTHFKTLEEIVSATNKIDPTKQEGFIIVEKLMDGTFKRVKVKSPRYVMLGLLSTKSSSSMNRRRILEIICMAEESEFMSYFPEWSKLYEEVKSKFEKYVAWVEKEMNELMSTEIWKTLSTNPDASPDERLEFFKLISKKSEDIKKMSWQLLKEPNITIREVISKQEPRKLETSIFRNK